MARKKSDLKLNKSAKRIRESGLKLDKYFDDIPKELRRLATASSDLARISTINAILRSRETAKKNGITFKDWKQSIKKDKLTKLTKAQAESAYATTLAQIYNTGVYQAAKDNGIPYLRYRAILDGVVRPTHEARDGIVKRTESDYWIGNTPPIDHRCRCTVQPITKGRASQIAKAEGRSGLSTPNSKIRKQENEVIRRENKIRKDSGQDSFKRKDFNKERDNSFKNNPNSAVDNVLKELNKQIDKLPPGLKRPFRESVRLSEKQSEVWFERFKNNFTSD